jgi:hypothetical protein
MEISNYLDLDGDYKGYVADVGGNFILKKEGIIMIVVDILRQIETTKLNVIPCSVVQVPNDYYAWIIKSSGLVVKTYDFT